MTTATPSAQAMPVGTILCASDHMFFEVVRATAQTVWVKGLREKQEEHLVALGPLFPSEEPT